MNNPPGIRSDYRGDGPESRAEGIDPG